MGRYGNYRKSNALSWRQAIWSAVLIAGIWIAATEGAGYGLLVGAACWFVTLLLLLLLGPWAWRHQERSGQ